MEEAHLGKKVMMRFVVRSHQHACAKGAFGFWPVSSLVVPLLPAATEVLELELFTATVVAVVIVAVVIDGVTGVGIDEAAVPLSFCRLSFKWLAIKCPAALEYRQ